MGGEAGSSAAGGSDSSGGASGSTSAGSGGSAGSDGSAGSNGSAGSGGSEACEADTDCTDDDACNGHERCKSDRCIAGTPLGDGAFCDDSNGAGYICSNQKCSKSVCGDGLVDTRVDESCDDGNLDDSDGCKSDCTFTCESNPECLDANVCNGEESCADHRCAAGEPLEQGSACSNGADDAAICNGKGLCVSSGCGDGFVDTAGGEDCEDDDGPNGNDADGCTDSCRYTCKLAVDCDDADVCDGSETCDLGSHTCKPGTPLDCDDTQACTTDTCDAASGCSSTLIDLDADGFFAGEADGSCKNSGGNDVGGDCDDIDPALHPNTWWYKDCDGDGYAANEDGKIRQCVEPPAATGCVEDDAKKKWTTRAPDDTLSTDCADWTEGAVNPAFAHPGQKSYFNVILDVWSPAHYDYNCDDVDTPLHSKLSSEAACQAANCSEPGWVGSVVPECGESGELLGCKNSGSNCTSPQTVVQSCH